MLQDVTYKTTILFFILTLSVPERNRIESSEQRLQEISIAKNWPRLDFRSTALNNFRFTEPEQWTGNPKAVGLNPARDQFFAMLISCSRCSDGSMRLPFWYPLSQIVRLKLKYEILWLRNNIIVTSQKPNNLLFLSYFCHGLIVESGHHQKGLNQTLIWYGT